MNTTGWDLASAIADVSAIERSGQLSEMLTQLSIDCRGLPADRAQLFMAGEMLHTATVAKALTAMFDLPLAECQTAVRSILLRQPRRERALDLIDYYLGRHEAEPANPCTLGSLTQDSSVPASKKPATVEPGETPVAVTGKLTSMTKP
jgi:hypothetical protein